MNDLGFKITFDGRMWFIVSWRNGTSVSTKAKKHEYLCAFIDGVQACGFPNAEYDDAEFLDTMLSTLLLG
jgi:hypothetical protein